MKAWASEQPKDGDCVLICGHVMEGGPSHWFKVGDPITFTRPDMSTGTATWMCVCETCKGSPEANIRGDKIWKGDEPFIQSNNGTVH